MPRGWRPGDLAVYKGEVVRLDIVGQVTAWLLDPSIDDDGSDGIPRRSAPLSDLERLLDVGEGERRVYIRRRPRWTGYGASPERPWLVVRGHGRDVGAQWPRFTVDAYPSFALALASLVGPPPEEEPPC